MKKFKRILVANRGEIAIRVFRACKELGIRTVAIYSKEDSKSLFRTKADESYLIGENKGPIDAYLNIEEIISLAKKKGVDAIHPGYGFLSENIEFVEKCNEAGIEFIGPTATMMGKLGDKIQSKIVASSVNVPVIPGVDKAISSDEEAVKFANKCGYPVMLKASAGGGGRGMRIVRNEDELIEEYNSAKNEAKKAFGIDDIFIEKYLDQPKHIEVQILGDNYGDIVHLFERDCSIQRRHQKIIEFTPALGLSEEKRKEICDDALKIARAVDYRNAGTVEFLLDKNQNHYFIEMNPRIQVEHTISEMTTGVDIVQSQILIAQGYKLNSDEINIKSQEDIKPRGYAIQCRVTTEDPHLQFVPDSGKIDVYRTAGGFGIRLDGGNGYSGSIISPYYDSLLVKNTSWSRTFNDSINKAIRALRELRIEGVKTNVDFLINILNHNIFREGKCDTGFINNHDELFDIVPREDHELKLLKFLGNTIVNKTKGYKKEYDVPVVPSIPEVENLTGTKQILDEKGPKGLVEYVKNSKKLLLTDTTFRDAHQSLMATRMRTRDMVKIAKPTSYLAKDLFSLEMWGGATFDVAYRFLKEDPWKRLEKLRSKAPNILFQMLLRGSNGVGYKNYPDNVIRGLIKEAATKGIDVFRIFDSLNWVEGMQVSIDEVIKNDKIAEVCICYTGDILDESKDKYTLEYYVDLAKRIEKTGAHILGIKDMSALLKPYAANKLIKALKEEINIPIHLHTHDTTGNGVATILMAAEAGVDIVDTAFNSMSGITSQPALNSVVAALKNTKRDTGFDLDKIQKISDYWSKVRPVYSEFESDLKTSSAEIYKYEIPGGQYSNLKPQVESLGLGYRFSEVKDMFRKVNKMFGDIVKVTPSSKAVGDMAIYMIQNDLTPENFLEKGKGMPYPDSVEAFFSGMMGQPTGGFPKEIQKIVLGDNKAIECRPGELLEPEDFDAIKKKLKDEFDLEASMAEIISSALYPKVFNDYLKHKKDVGVFEEMGSDVFFHGLREGETSTIEINEGKVFIIKLLKIGKVDSNNKRLVVFEVNGNRREISILDVDKAKTNKMKTNEIRLVDENNENEIGASLPGKIAEIKVSKDEEVTEGQALLVMEAMKMETVLKAPKNGIIKKIYVSVDDEVKSKQLLIKLLDKE